MKKNIVFIAIIGISASLMADAYTKCASCHGMNGERKALGKSKIIADMSKEDILSSLLGYKDGTYGGSMKGIMKSKVKNLTNADIISISEKFGKYEAKPSVIEQDPEKAKEKAKEEKKILSEKQVLSPIDSLVDSIKGKIVESLVSDSDIKKEKEKDKLIEELTSKVKTLENKNK